MGLTPNCVVFQQLLSVFDLCVSYYRAEKTEVLSDDLLQVTTTSRFLIICINLQGF